MEILTLHFLLCSHELHIDVDIFSRSELKCAIKGIHKIFNGD